MINQRVQQFIAEFDARSTEDVVLRKHDIKLLIEMLTKAFAFERSEVHRQLLASRIGALQFELGVAKTALALDQGFNI